MQITVTETIHRTFDVPIEVLQQAEQPTIQKWIEDGDAEDWFCNLDNPDDQCRSLEVTERIIGLEE